MKVKYRQAGDLYLLVSFKTAVEDEKSFQLGQPGKNANIFKTLLYFSPSMKILFI